MKLLSIIFLILGAGCQGPVTDASLNGVRFELVFPASLQPHSPRWSRFLRRLVRIDVQLRSKAGILVEESRTPEAWDRLSFPTLKFPRFPEDVLNVSMRFWDRHKDGEPRSYAALTGKVRVSATEMDDDVHKAIPVKMNLHISAREFD